MIELKTVKQSAMSKVSFPNGRSAAFATRKSMLGANSRAAYLGTVSVLTLIGCAIRFSGRP
jgi:hypothetical protein